VSDKDRYDEMSGAELAAEAQERELPLSGKVAELRERLRAADASEGAGTGEEASDLPEPREPVAYAVGTVTLTEEQARQLTAGEAKVRQFTKHVSPTPIRKYAEGDQVPAVLVPAEGYALVVPFGIRIDLVG
jgi:hypothetical protein